MDSEWIKVEMDLGSNSNSNTFVYVPTADADASPPQPSPGPSVTSSSTSSHMSKSLSRSSSSKSKMCAICLASMKAGEAIFTSECAHSFHFQCIALSVTHGNQICPICRAHWKPVSLQPSTGPQNSAQDNPVFRRPSPRLNSNRHIYPANEPVVFNDDEALDLQTPNNNNNDNITSDESSLERVLMRTYTEVPAVARFTTLDDFAVLIHLKAPVSTSARAPVDLVTVLDISGSMAGTKMALLKRAMGFVIQNLGPADRLSVIVLSSTARRLFPLRKMSDTGKQHALQAVNSLIANGGTNIAEGLIKGKKVMNDRRVKNPVASMILLSDGRDNAGGWTNHQFIIPEGINVSVHAFGFGKDHDASLMHSISEMSGGTFSFIETESVIQDAFAQCIGGLLSVVVKGLQVIVESANPTIRIQSLKTGSYTSHLTADRKSGRIEVGDLYADEERDFLVSVNVPKEAKLTFRDETLLLKVHCSYTDPMTNEMVNLVSENVTIERPESVGNENVVSVEVDRQRNRLQSAEAMVQARTAAEEGDLSRAISIIENFRKVLNETVAAKSGDHLCMALDAELKEMQGRMASRDVYEHSGRAYVLSGLSSHTSQRATARGSPNNGSSLVQGYQTPLMTDMVTRSQAVPFQPAQSSQAQTRPS